MKAPFETQVGTYPAPIQQMWDQIVVGLPLQKGSDFIHQAYADFDTAIATHQVALHPEQQAFVTKRYRRAMEVCAERALQSLEKRPALPEKAKEIDATVKKIVLAFERGGWKDFLTNPAYRSGKTFTRLKKAQQQTHQNAYKVWRQFLTQADAASYGVNDVLTKRNETLENARGAGFSATTMKQIRREVEEDYRQACARCCSARINRLVTAPFVNKMNNIELRAEEAAIRSLFAETKGVMAIESIDKTIQAAHRQAIERGMAQAAQRGMDIEEIVRLDERIAKVGFSPKERAKIEAALTMTVLMGKATGSVMPIHRVKPHHPEAAAAKAAPEQLLMAG